MVGNIRRGADTEFCFRNIQVVLGRETGESSVFKVCVSVSMYMYVPVC